MQLSREGPVGRLLAPPVLCDGSGLTGRTWILGSWSKTHPTPAACASCRHSTRRAGLWGWWWVAARATHGLSVDLDGCLRQAPLLLGRRRSGAGSLSLCFPFAAPAGVRKAPASTGWDSSALAGSLLTREAGFELVLCGT